MTDWSKLPPTISVKYGCRSAGWVWAFGATALLVLVLSLLPTVPNMPTTGWDKANHFLPFAALSWPGCQAFPWSTATVLLGLLAYGAVIEVLKSLTPYRFAELNDVWADGLGVMAGWLCSQLQQGWINYNHRHGADD
jgi:VanZ family protein